MSEENLLIGDNKGDDKFALDALPALGVGIGFRERYRADVLLRRDEIDFLEITADHYLDASPDKLRELDLLAEHFTLIPHGLNLSLGSAEGIDENYLEKLARLVNYLNPPWWSEHLALTRAGGIDIGHLTPLVFNRETVEIVTRNIAQVREYVAAPLILENITYMLRLPGDELSEAEFLSEILERANCGLLLDVTNLYINSINHEYDFCAFLDALPSERIVQLHFVGVSQDDGVLIDAHARAVTPEIWNVFDETLKRAPVKGAILERDEHLPPFDEIAAELKQARELGRFHKRWA